MNKDSKKRDLQALIFIKNSIHPCKSDAVTLFAQSPWNRVRGPKGSSFFIRQLCYELRIKKRRSIYQVVHIILMKYHVIAILLYKFLQPCFDPFFYLWKPFLFKMYKQRINDLLCHLYFFITNQVLITCSCTKD